MTIASPTITLNPTRIDAACFIDGNDDEYIVEFWHLPGSIYRTVYNRRTTCTRTTFVPVDSWEYAELLRYLEGQCSQYVI